MSFYGPYVPDYFDDLIRRMTVASGPRTDRQDAYGGLSDSFRHANQPPCSFPIIQGPACSPSVLRFARFYFVYVLPFWGFPFKPLEAWSRAADTAPGRSNAGFGKTIRKHAVVRERTAGRGMRNTIFPGFAPS